jgi:hypothetical protein
MSFWMKSSAILPLRFSMARILDRKISSSCFISHLGSTVPFFSEKAVSDYGMKMRVKPGVISKGVNDYHKVWDSIRMAKHN